MTVKQLKEKLHGLDDEMVVVIPTDMEVFDGYFYSPCVEESGPSTMGVNENLKTEEDMFILVPCGFFDEKHEKKVAELN